jgi:hypothetical protein
MIVDKNIEVKIAKYNIEHYKNYFDVKLGDVILINTELHLQKESNKKINVQCDICSLQRYIKFQAYTKNINSNKNYPIYTCDKCSHLKLKDSNKLKYGVEYYSQHPDRNDKVKKTSLDKYGVEHFSKSKLFKEKAFETNLKKFGFVNPFMDVERIKSIFKEKYGVEHPSQLEEFNKKIKETSFEKYGYYNILSSPIVRNKIKKTNLSKYGYESHMKSDIMRLNYDITNNKYYIKYLDNNISLFNCDKELDHTFEMTSDNYHNRTRSNISLCTVCNPIGENRSVKEKELLEYIKSIYLDEVICSYRDGLEIDIYLPKLKIGFEFNGLYWHSDEYKERNYHLDKTNYFKDKLIKVIHIWEDDWVFKKEIIKSQLKNLLNLSCKIFARKCNVREVSTKESREFLENNHIQGKVNSSLKLGLYYNEYLVSLMTFDYFEGRKKMEDSGWNLNRFCNRTGISVVGGASKLLKYFTNNYNVKRIISYADKDWSVGDLYYKLGFSDIGGNGPDYKYIVDGKRVHKSRYKKSKLKTKLTESKQMELNGIKRIYDCGKIKFEKLF